MFKLWKCYATYSDGCNKQYFGCMVYAECADDAFRYLDERAKDLGLVCLAKSVQREDVESEVKQNEKRKCECNLQGYVCKI